MESTEYGACFTLHLWQVLDYAKSRASDRVRLAYAAVQDLDFVRS